VMVCLPLTSSANCTTRVGNDTREWQYGKALVVDESFEHQSRNGGDEPQVQLMFEVWNPRLNEAEQELVSGLLNGVREYYGAEG